MSRPRVLTEHEVAWLRQAWADREVTIREIYAKLGIGGSTLMRLRNDLQLGPKGFEWNEENRAEALRLSADGWKPSEIGRRIGASKNTVYQWLKRRGAVGGVLLQPTTHSEPPPGYEAMLRRVAAWDSAAAKGLALLERQRGEA